MAFFLNTEIPQKKAIHNALQNIYGIGDSLSLHICKKTGILPTTYLNNLSKKKLQKLFFFIETNYIINDNLKQKQQQYLTKLKILKNKKKV